MNNFLLFSILIGSCVAGVAGQTTQPTARENAERLLRQQHDSHRRFESLKSIGEVNKNGSLPRRLALQSLANIYRKTTREESKRLAPDKEDLKKHAQFLRQADTGLIRLIADRGCAKNINIINVSEQCLKYSMPGAGSSYSFRTTDHRIRRLSDLTYVGDGFISTGILAHAILVNVGDVPLERVSLQTAGLKYLNDFQVAADYVQATELDRLLTEGVESNGFYYSRAGSAAENATYVLRSIAYRGSYYRALDGFVYDELDFDKRKDVTVAFRIVRRDDESVTILWKQLAAKDAPKVKRSEKDDQKIKENDFLARETDK